MIKSIQIFTGLSIILGIGTLTVTAQNYKIKQSTSMMGQDMTSTVYVKGARKRTESGGMMGMGGDVADIEQCDMKRNIKVSDKKKMYFVEPFATDDSSPNPVTRPSGPATTGKATKGGTITMTTAINDTGERKQMFGLTARHIKTSMTSQSSPDACSQNDMSIETDGWYIDLPLFSCPMIMPRNPMGGMEQKRGCMDRTVIKSTGGGKLGVALELTTTMKMGEGQDFSMTLHTLEFSKATLEDALFDIPAGYSAANSSQDLYGRPDFSAMMKGGMGNNDDDEKPSKSAPKMPDMSSMGSTSASKKAGTIRIGVMVPTNNGGEAISTANMQMFLAQKLTAGNVEGVAVTSESDARSSNCDYVLSSDFSKLKQSTAGKIGGMFGKVTNTSVGGNYDAQVDFRLLSLKSGQVTLQNKAASKSESNVDRAAEGVLNQEASTILAAGLKN